MRIVIPSMGRSQTMTTHRLLSDAIVCVPESEAAEYSRALNGHLRVVTHPDTVIGLTPKLNWCFEHLEDEDGIVFLDDDIVQVARCYLGAGASGQRFRDPATVHAVIEQTFRVSRELGAYYFGWANGGHGPVQYKPFAPFSVTGFSNGCSMGFVAGHGLRFDERIVAKNDYDIAALNAYWHRIMFRDNRFQFEQRDTFKGRGGLAKHRTSQTEKRDVEILQRKYGSDVIVRGGRGNRRRDYAGVEKITLRLPY